MEQVETLLQSLVIILLGFQSFLSEELYPEILFLLTDEQYELFSKDLYKTRQLFLHGLPGSGKTILALRIVEKIMNVFHCRPDDILYICENIPLKRSVSKRTNCQVVTRKTFMKNNFDNIQHIIIDEAQNFRTEDGDWYGKAKHITQRQTDCPGILYVFLDYFQTNHLCFHGLSDFQQQEPKILLSRMLRYTDVIANYLQDIMKEIREHPPPNIPREALVMCPDPGWLQGVPSSLEITDYLTSEQMCIYIAEKCQYHWRCGYYPQDVAVLFSRAGDIERYRGQLVLAMMRSMSQLYEESDSLVQVMDSLDVPGNHIALDSIHRFSGLERNIVFGIFPEAPQTDIFHNILLCLASRAKRNLYIVKVCL